MHINNGHDYIFNKSTGEAGEPSNCRRTEQLWRQVQPRIIISEMRCVTVCRSEVTLVGARLLVFKALESGSNEAVMRYLWKVIAWNERSCPEGSSCLRDSDLFLLPPPPPPPPPPLLHWLL